MDISNKFDDPIFTELLLSIQNVAAQLDIPFFVVGATARDLLLWPGNQSKNRGGPQGRRLPEAGFEEACRTGPVCRATGAGDSVANACIPFI